MAKHPTREELIAAARSASTNLDKHLKSCTECRNLVKLLESFPVWGRPPLPDAPSAWREKAARLASADGVLRKVGAVIARVTFDSWALPGTVGVRDEGSLDQRRLRLEAEELVLDLRAERQSHGWCFVAQVKGAESLEHAVILKVGKQSVRSDGSGFWEWKSVRPPSKVTLYCGSFLVESPELSWKTLRSP